MKKRSLFSLTALCLAVLSVAGFVSCTSPRFTVRTGDEPGVSTPVASSEEGSEVVPFVPPVTPSDVSTIPAVLPSLTPSSVLTPSHTPTPVTPTPVTPTPVTPTPVTPTPVTPTPVTPTPVTPTPVTPTPVTPTPIDPPVDPLKFVDYQYTFRADLSEYERYMNVRGEDYLILVNPDHPLPKNYEPKDLVDAVNTRSDRDPVQLRLYAEKAMEALYKEAEANGILYKNTVTSSGKNVSNVLGITTAYRSYAVQNYLFNKYLKRDMALYPELSEEEVRKIVATYSCPPGTSEHQTGLCVDMHNWPTAGRYMADEFAASKAGQWLIENCYKFGYVLRFDKDKTDKTGITYESWHFRFVGRFHATRMHELNLCLEEYVEYLAKYGYEINQNL